MTDKDRAPDNGGVAEPESRPAGPAKGTGMPGGTDPNAPTPQGERAAVEQDDGAVPSEGY